jgi:hypothetical protein
VVEVSAVAEPSRIVNLAPVKVGGDDVDAGRSDLLGCGRAP